METDWQERRVLEDRLANGQGVTAEEVRHLIADADAGERAEVILGGLRRALRDQLGIVVIDTTTDDDGEEVRLELVRAETGTDGSVVVRHEDLR